MTDTLLTVLAIELGAILFAMVGIFALETWAMILRAREQNHNHGGGSLRILSPEELIERGFDPRQFSNPPKPVEPVSAQAGQYL